MRLLLLCQRRLATASAGVLAIGVYHHGTQLRCDHAIPPPPPPPRTAEPPTTRSGKNHLALSILRNIASGVFHLVRLMQLVGLFLPPLVVRMLCGDGNDAAWQPMLVSALDRSGPVFQKFVQWLCAHPRTDWMAGPEFIQALRQVSFPQEPLADTLLTLKESGIELVEFCPVPWGVGCVAQVHQAVIKTPTTPPTTVAVKIIKRQVQRDLERDLHLIHWLCKAYAWLQPKLGGLLPSAERLLLLHSPEQAVESFSRFMLQQCDLGVEFDNLGRLRQQQPRRKRNQRQIQVTFPEPLLLLPTRQVLMETLHVNAVPLAEFALTAPPAVRAQVANELARAFLEMALTHNLAHADLHMDNILVRVSPAAAGTGSKVRELVLLDAGLVTELSPEDHGKLDAIVRSSMERGDVRTTVEMFLRRFTATPTTAALGDDDPHHLHQQRFIAQVDELVSQETERVLDQQNDIDVAGVARQVMLLGHNNHVRIHAPGFASLAVGFFVLNGTLEQLDPTWNVCSYSYLLLDLV